MAKMVTPKDIVRQYIEGGVPLFTFNTAKYNGLTYLLFDVEELDITFQGTKKKAVSVKPKKINVQGITSETGNEIIWYEDKNVDKVFKAQAKTVSNTDPTIVLNIGANDYYGIGDIYVNDYILIPDLSAGVDYYARIQSIDTNTNTITIADVRDSSGQLLSTYSITLASNNPIRVLYSENAPADTATSEVSDFKLEKYSAPIQFFHKIIPFTYKELNTNYEFYTASQMVNQKFNRARLEIINAFANAVWNGKGVSGAAETDKTQMLGILTAVKKGGLEATGNPDAFIRDISTLTNTTDQANAILEELEKAYSTGLYESGEVTMVATSGAISKLRMITKDFYTLGGITPYITTLFNVEFNVAKLKDIPTGFNGEIYVDEALNRFATNSAELGKDFIVILPKDKVAAYQLNYDGIDLNGNLTKAGIGGRIYEMDAVNQDKVFKNYKQRFKFETQFGLLPAGYTTGAYRIIKL